MSTEAAAAEPPGTWPAGVLSTGVGWMFKGAWAVLDQGLFALSNFAINIVVARWSSPTEYGAFTIAYTIFLLLTTVHTALIADPMIVFGTGKYREKLPSYLAVLLRGHWLLALAASLTLAATGLALGLAGEWAVAYALLGLAAANPFILLLWLIRRSCYIRVDPRLAASGSVLYMAVLLAGAYLLIRLDWLTPTSAFSLMGVGSVVSAIWMRSKLSFWSAPGNAAELSRSVTAAHWAFGRWGVCAGLLGGAAGHLYFVVMPARYGPESAASLKALMNLVMPAIQALIAVSVVTVPALVRARDTGGFGGLVRRLLILYSTGALLYWMVLGFSHEYLVRWLYGGRYSSESSLLWLLGLLPVVNAGACIFECALRARERSDAIFRAYLFSFVSTCVLGIPFALAWGTGGAIAGLLISTGLAMGSMAWSLRRRRTTREPELPKYASIEPAGGDTAMPLNLQKRLSLILRFCEPNGKRLIDCGCGAGEYVMALESQGVRAWGIEYDREKLREYRKHYPTSHRLCVGDLLKPGLLDASFDVALLNEVLEHVPNDAEALAEVERLLKDDGTLIVFSPNRRYPFETHGVTLTSSSRRLPHYFPFVPYFPMRLGRRIFTYWARNYWPGELRRLVTDAGFTIIEINYVWQTFEAISRNQPALIAVLAPALRRMANVLERVPVVRSFGTSQVIVARKNGRRASRVSP
ncbi:MAG: methyltransferase domain-containing protein [Luteitalea sp.]|nr:methyltransferase domain-containing protein [Luteitalea sp.]